MQKRKYVQVKLIEDQIQLMRAKGMTNREIVAQGTILCVKPNMRRTIPIHRRCADRVPTGEVSQDGKARLTKAGLV